ncbi:MAG: glycosyltransferase [Flavobacteriaceae bacterium]|nr:glycosyltransferase [Flavobacteriaceae bacterium]
MNQNSDIRFCIVVPCYNEEKRLPSEDFKSFLQINPEVLVCFVNDGSSDNTLGILNRIKQDFPYNADVLSLDQNKGKAEAVRLGFQYCNANFSHEFIAYLDADLATTLEECVELKSNLRGAVNFVFGSRMVKLGSEIKRSNFRFVTGRIIATFISKILKLNVYDTQCGCKLFSRDISVRIFDQPFLSKWLFDVELFKRFILVYGREIAKKKMIEIPLKKWIDKGDSKVSMTYFFRMWWDLYSIHRYYKSKGELYALEPNIIDENA